MDMTDFLTRLEEKVDRLQESTNHIKIEQVEMRHILARNTEDVAKHIKRTDLLEEQVLFPIKALRWILTGVVGAAGAIGAVYGVVKLFAA